MARQSQPLEAALARGDDVLRGVDWLKHHPAAIGAALAAAIVVSPRRTWRWGKRAFFLWRGWQAVRSAVLK